MAATTFDVLLKLDAAGYVREASQIRGANDGLGRSASGVASSFAKLGTVLAGLGLARLAKDFAAASVEAGIFMQRSERAMSVAVGGMEAAREEIAFVREEATRLGLPIKESIDGFTKLAASARGMKMEGQGVRDLFQAVGEMSTVMALSAEDVNGILRALTQTMSKGKIQAEELRGQIGERLPGAFQIAARAMGMTAAELDSMMAQGKITAEELLPRLAAELHRMFGEEAVQAAGDANAQFNRMRNAAFLLRAEVGEQLAPAMGDLAETLTEMAGDEEMLAFFRALGTSAVEGVRLAIVIVQELREDIDDLREVASLVAPYIGDIVEALEIFEQSLEGFDGTTRDFVEGLVGGFDSLKTGITSFIASSIREFALFVDVLGNVAADINDMFAGVLDLAKRAARFGMTLAKIPGPTWNPMAAKALKAAVDNLADWEAGIKRSANETRVSTDQMVGHLHGMASEVENLGESASGLAQEVEDAGRSVRDLGGDLDETTDSVEDHAKAAKDAAEAAESAAESEKAWAEAVDRLAQAQREHDAIREATTQTIDQVQAAIERTRVAEESFAAAVSSGNAVLVGGIPVLTARGIEMVRAALATHDYERATRILTEGLERQAILESAVRDAQSSRIAVEGELRAHLEGGAEAVKRYRLELEAWTAAWEAGGVAMQGGLPVLTPEGRQIYDDTIATGAASDAIDTLGEHGKEVGRDVAETWGRLLADAISGSADGWEDWARMAIDAIRQVEEYRQRQQASSGSGGGGGTDTTGAASNAAMASGASWAAVLGVMVAAWGAIEDRIAERHGRRYDTRLVVGGTTYAPGDDRGFSRTYLGQDAAISHDEAAQMVDQIQGALLGLVDALGATADSLAAIGLEIRNDGEEFRVTVGDWSQTFTDLGAAISTGLAQSLAQSDLSGLTENTAAAISYAAGLGSKLAAGRLQEIVDRALALDRLQIPESLASLRDLGVAFRSAVREAREVGFAVDDVVTELRVGIEGVRDSLVQELSSIIPGSGLLDQVARFHDLSEEILGFNQGLQELGETVDDVRRREEELDRVRDRLANAPPSPGTPGGAGRQLNEDDGIGGGALAEALGPGGLAGIAADAADAIEEVAVRIDDVVTISELYSDSLPDPIDLERLAEAQRALSSQVEQTLGENILRYIEDATIRGRVEAANHQLRMMELESQYAALVALGTVSAAVLAAYRDAIDQIGGGDLVTPTQSGGGRGRQRREVGEDFREAAADVAAALAGATSSQLDYARAVERLREQAEEGRIPLWELAQAIRDLAALELRDIAAPFAELAQQADETDLETTMRQARERLEEALADALARAADNPEAYAEAVAAIQAGFAAEVAAVVEDALIGLGDRARSLAVETDETVASIAYLLASLDQLGITAADVANAVLQGTLPGLLDLIAAQAERVGDEEMLADIEERRREMELSFARIQFEAMVAILAAAGAIDAALQALIDDARQLFALPDADPGDGDDDETRTLAGLGTAIEGLRRRAEDWSEALAQLDEDLADGLITQRRYNEAIDAFGTEAVLDFGGALFGFLDRYYQVEGQHMAQRQALADLQWASELAQLQVQFAMVQALGILSAETLAFVEDTLDWILTEGPPALDDLTRATTGFGNAAAATTSILDEARKLLDELRGDYERLMGILDSMGDSDGIRGRLEDVVSQIAEAEQLTDKLTDLGASQMAALARSLGITVAELLDSLPTDAELAELQASAIGDILDDVIGEWEGGDTLRDKLDEGLSVFVELLDLADEYGLDLLRIQAAQSAFLADFFTDLRSGVQALYDDLTTGPRSITPVFSQLQAAQAEFESLIAAALAGDLDAIDQADEAAEALLALAEQFFAGGAGYGSVVDLVTQMLGQILDITPDDILDEADFAPYQVQASDIIAAPISTDQILAALLGGSAGSTIQLGDEFGRITQAIEQSRASRDARLDAMIRQGAIQIGHGEAIVSALRTPGRVA